MRLVFNLIGPSGENIKTFVMSLSKRILNKRLTYEVGVNGRFERIGIGDGGVVDVSVCICRDCNGKR